jgi:hypothetical protein
MKKGINPLEYKPEVCWQLPLRREDSVDDENGHVTSTIRQWDRKHWGKGGEEFHWWCTESHEAFVGKQPVYKEMQAELTKMVGASVYDRLVAYLRQRDRLRTERVPLPHPAVRNRKPAASSAGKKPNSKTSSSKATAAKIPAAVITAPAETTLDQAINQTT